MTSEYLRRRWKGLLRSSLALALLIGLVGCEELLVDPNLGQVRLTISSSMRMGTGSSGPAAAFEIVDEIQIRVTDSNGTTVVDESVEFVLTEGVATLDPLQVNSAGTVVIEAELLHSGDLLFAAGTTAILQLEETATTELIVSSVPSSVVIQAPPPIDALGETWRIQS